MNPLHLLWRLLTRLFETPYGKALRTGKPVLVNGRIVSPPSVDDTQAGADPEPLDPESVVKEPAEPEAVEPESTQRQIA